MIKTPNLNLPVYDNVSKDTFRVADWNEANTNIDYVFGELKKNPNVNAIDITARQDIINNHRSVTEQLDSIIQENKINVKLQGVKTDGTNQIEKLKQIINLNVFADNPTFYFPTGDYCIEETLLITRRCNIEMDRGARLYTNTNLDFLVEYLTDKASGNETIRSIKNTWRGGVLDGQDKVKCLIALGCYTNFTMQDVCFYNFIEKGLMTRKVANDSVGTGGFMGQFLYFRNWNSHLGSIAIYNNGNDNKFMDITIMNIEQGIYTIDGIFTKIHMWLDRITLFPTSKFAHVMTSYSSFENCIIDTIRTGFTSEYNKQVRVKNCNFIASNYVYTQELAIQYGFIFFSGEGYYYADNCLAYIDYGTHTVCDSPRLNHIFNMCRFSSNGTINNGTYKDNTVENGIRQETLNNPDLNNYNKLNCTYKISTVTNGLNFPSTGKEASMLVVNVAGTLEESRIVTQTLYPNSTPRKFYQRRYLASNNSWSEWVKYLASADL